MLKNYLKIALRNLSRSKAFSAINIFGLAIGIAACLLILQYVTFEQSFDTFHEKANRLYRIRLDNYQNGKLAFRSATSYPGIAPALQTELPEVEATARLYHAYGVISYENTRFREEEGYYADGTILSMFTFRMLLGDTKALSQPNSVVLSASMARKYFQEQNPVGKIIRMGQDAYMVKGIFEDYPLNSHLKINYLFSFLTEEDAQTSWEWYDFYTYVLLKPGTDVKALEAKLPGMVQKYHGEELKKRNANEQLLLQPLTSIHLYSDLNQEAEVNGNGKAVQFMLIIAISILVIAWVNYINLATARAIERAKEVGIRKVSGANRSQLIGQFLLESLVLNVVAAALALFLVNLALPYFNILTGKPLSFSLWTYSQFWLISIPVFLIGALLSGLYPAFVLSGFKPVAVLKGKFRNTAAGITLRQSLIVFQFAASVILIIGTLTVYRQLNFMLSQDLGFDMEQILVLRGPASRDSTFDAVSNGFKTEVLRNTAVRQITGSTYVPGYEILWTNGARRLQESTQPVHTVYISAIDYDFLPTFQIGLKAGRNFSRDFQTDHEAIILNETAIKLLDFSSAETALQQKVQVGGDTFTVVGVTYDYHQEGLRKSHNPMVFRMLPEDVHVYSLKIQAGNLDQTIRQVKQTYETFFPEAPFEYFFLDDFFNRQYQADRQFGKVFSLFALLAVCVASLGLLGLASFTTAQRTKEIGVRKVLGATVSSIVGLLFKDFVKLVMLSIAIAVPIGFMLMQEWLSNYAYRTPLSAWIFVAAGVLVLLIALLTVSYQSIKAAMANPVKSLRSE